jgi:hypothetical protein
MSDLFSQPVPVGKSGGIPCSRCGRICVIKGTRNENARLLRAATAKTKHGLCATCGLRSFIESVEALRDIFSKYHDATPEAFKLPHVQQQLRQVLIAGGADVRMEEIDFDHLVDNWNLPLK